MRKRGSNSKSVSPALVLSLVGRVALAGDSAAGQRLQSAIDRAQPPAVVTVAPGRYADPLHVTKPLTLRGEDRSRCVLEVEANEPAIYLHNAGKVVIENLTVRYAPKSLKDRPKLPIAIAVEGTEAVVRNCHLEPIRDPTKTPCALLAKGRSTVRFESGRCDGFNFTITFVDGAGGEVLDSSFHNAGHCAITLHRGSRVSIAGNLITGSRYHGVRSSGGWLDLRHNLLADHRVSGAYLGNKNARGTIRNNLFIGNGSGIASYYRSKVTVEHNVFLESKHAGIGTWDSCPLTIRGNSFVSNRSAITRYVGKSKLSPVPLTLEGNHYWQNQKDTVECDKSETALTGDPLFEDQAKGHFAPTPGSPLLDEGAQPAAGLVDAEPIHVLWERRQEER